MSFFDNCNDFEVNGGQFTNVAGNMTQYSGNASYSVNPGARARDNARPRHATTGPHYAQPNGNPSYGYSQFPAPPNPQFQAPPNPQFQGPPNPQFQGPPNPQFQGPPNPQFQRQPYPPLQGPPNPQFQGPPNPQFQRQPYPPLQGPPNPQFQPPPQFQGLPPPNSVHPRQAPNFGRSFSDSPAYAQNSQNSGPRLPDPRAVNPEGVLAAQIDARRAARAGAGNPPFRNPPPLQSSVSTPEARRDFARNTRAPTWSSAPPPSQPIPNSNTRAPTWSSAQPPSQAMPIPIPNSSRRTSHYSNNGMPLSSSPEEADRASWAPPSSAPMNQYPPVTSTSQQPRGPPSARAPPVASTSQQPQVPPSARARQKSRKMDESNSSSDSEGTAKPHRRKKPSRH